MLKVLDATDTTSDSFGTTGSPINIQIDTHKGGAWVLQSYTPAGNWIDVNATDFTANGEWVADTLPGGVYRFHGGTVGAQIWVYGAVET